MAIGKEIQLYGDIGKSQPVYPKTNAKCVYYDDGTRLDRMIAAANPRNLLDNSDFRNPVNQRGKTEWNEYGYTIDRWMLYSADASQQTARLTASGLQCDYDGVMRQIIPKEAVAGNLLSNCTLVFGRPDGTVVVKHGQGWLDEKGNYVFGLDAGTWAYAAVYEGIYTAETLPEYHPKGYVAELYECMWYYRTYSKETRFVGYISGGATGFYFFLDRPMRIAPTMTNSAKFILRTVSGYSSVTPYDAPTSPKSMYARGANAPYICLEWGEVLGTNNTPVVAEINSGTLEFSADY